MNRIALALCLLGFGTAALADFSVLEVGTWVKRDTASSKASPLVLTIQAAGSGRKLTYTVPGPGGKPMAGFEVTALTQLDGKDAPVITNGKPTGVTWAIRKVDAHHAVTVLRFNGKEYGTSKTELSPDGKVMKNEEEITSSVGGQMVGKRVEVWDRK